MSDPLDPTKTRNFAENDVMLWEFDLLANTNMLINTKFQFCKECKVYTNISDLNSTGDDELDALMWKVHQMAASGNEEVNAHQPAVPRKKITVPLTSAGGSSDDGSTRSYYSTVPISLPSEAECRSRSNLVRQYSLTVARMNTEL